MVSPPWRSFSVRFGNHVVVVTVTTVKLSVDCICSGRIVLFAPVEHPVFVPITFFQLSHLPDISSNVPVSCFKAFKTAHCCYVSTWKRHTTLCTIRRWRRNMKHTQANTDMEMKPNMVLCKWLLSQIFGARGLKLKTECDNKLNAPVSKTRARHATDNALVAH